jgi:hypothetical protein
VLKHDPGHQVLFGLVDHGFCHIHHKGAGQHRLDAFIRRRTLLPAGTLVITSRPSHRASLRRGITALYIERQFVESCPPEGFVTPRRHLQQADPADPTTNNDHAAALISGVISLIAATPGWRPLAQRMRIIQNVQ